MEIILCDFNSKLLNSWREFFNNAPNVKIIEGDITTIKCDAIVSPANSFGFMDGGLDYALSERFGWDLQTQLQRQIKESPMGELLVGQALVIPTNDSIIPFLISAPTMRIPTNVNIETSVNAYLAMKALLISAKAESRIKSIGIPGLCTGIGGMHPMVAARQMYFAYDEIILGNKMDFKTYVDARKYHWNINPQGKI